MLRTWRLGCYISFTQMQSSPEMMLGIGIKRKLVGLDDKLFNLSWGEFRQYLKKNHDNGELGTMSCLAWGVSPKAEEEFVSLSEVPLHIFGTSVERLCFIWPPAITDLSQCLCFITWLGP